MLQFIRNITFIISAMLLTCPGSAYSAPATVDTSTSAAATSGTENRKTFYDEINRTHWAAYYNGSAVEFSYTDDLESSTWTSAGTLSYNTSEFTLTYKTISGVPYVLVAATANTYDIVLRRGVISATSIAFDAEVTVFDGSDAGSYYYAPSIVADDSNHLWIAALWDMSDNQLSDKVITVRRSDNTIAQDLSSYSLHKQLGKPDRERTQVSIINAPNNGVRVISGHNSQYLEVWEYDSGTWEQKAAGGDLDWFGMEGSPITESVNAIAEGVDGIYVGMDRNGIYRWDGVNWHSLGSGINGWVYAIIASGTDVYVGGSFLDAGGNPDADNVARWDGSAWQALGSGLSEHVRAMKLHGGNLYVGGRFTDAGGNAAADKVAFWNGSAWNALGSGLSDDVLALDASGSDIYVGGSFLNAGGNASADRIARWNGASWQALGSGLNSNVAAVKVSGTDVYVGGHFVDAGGNAAADYIARWTGAAWQPLGPGLPSAVNTLDVSGTTVYAGGFFTDAGGDTAADYLAVWDGASWSNLGGSVNWLVDAISLISGNVYVGGWLTQAGGSVPTHHLAVWNGSVWNAIGSGMDAPVDKLAVYGDMLVAGGSFTDVGGNPDVDRIALWDGSAWHALGNGLSSWVVAITVSGTDIYAGGQFVDAGGNASADRIARWDGSAWLPLGGGITGSGWVDAIAISGSNLYAGGYFSDSGGDANADYIVRWDGTAWHALGTGLNDEVGAILPVGTDLYVGGIFTDAGGDPNADSIARWDGTTWHALGTGISGWVATIAQSGTDIFVGGNFTDAGGNPDADYIARWDGTAWHALGTGLNARVFSISVSGSNIYITGSFTDAGGNPDADYTTRWDGSSWQAIGTGLNGPAYDSVFHGGRLYVGGDFTSSGDEAKPLGYFAWYGPTAASNLDATSNFSATSDASGNLHLLYNNADDEVVYRKYDDNLATWQTAVVLDTPADVDSLGFAKTNSGNLQALWLEGNNIKRKSAVTPFESADWQVAADVLYSTGTNVGLSVGSGEQWGRIPYFWTSGGGSPYDVIVDYLDLTHSISGNVNDGGSALSGVALDAGIHGSVTTDGNGNYTISGLPWGESYTITPSLTNYSFTPVSASGTVSANVTADFTITSISGIIEQNGTPVSGATVTLVTSGGTVTTTTDANGSYSFTGVEPGAGTITVEKNGYVLINESVNISPGSNTPTLEIVDVTLSPPLYSYWNGFLEMVNVLELMNTGDAEVSAEVTFYDIDGAELSVFEIVVPANSQRDVILNDVSGFSAESYGLLKVAGSGIDGRVTFYRLTSDTWGDEFDFVYSLELMPATIGETSGVWNTYAPGGAVAGRAEPQLGMPGKASTLSPNWLNVANLDSATHIYTITYRNQSGSVITTATLSIPPYGKRDIQAGHEFTAPTVGLITVTPDSLTSPYLATVTRYGENFAFTIPTQPGNSTVVALPAGSEGLNVLELGNTSNSANPVQLTWYGMNGELLKSETATLPPYAQQHFIPTDVLPEGSYGLVRITATSNILAGAASYLPETAYYQSAHEVFGTIQSGTYNTYLGMDNWLRIVNASSATQMATISYGMTNATISVPAHGRRDILIPTGSATQNYGSFTLQSTVPGVFTASVVRSRVFDGVVDFQSVVGLR
ncbi:MAG: carboxypeptidase-like regulatory domain-containing protein [bacterium]|nr:carboxypeptidase-like regulatory domain-containing protein [bacterium]